ncbi:MAG: hypothetical protein NVS4B9_22690 [Ktedonobacteraceae bacterium]
MPNSQLLGKNFNGGLQAPHYFNGRLLTADALQADQQAVLTRQARLGKASGYGIIEGLVVKKVPTDKTKISITAGIGLNCEGQVIHLASDVTFQPIPQASQPVSKPTVDVGKFGSRAMSVPPPTPPKADGVYLLTALPTTRFEGTVPMKAAVGGVSNGMGNAPGCGNKWEVDGVQFKVIRLANSDLTPLLSSDDLNGVTVDEQHLRNILAHWCYGTLTLQDLGVDPFDFTDNYSGLDPLTIPDLTTSDLPLAVFHWDGAALTFVDLWSARRRVTHPSALAGTQSSALLVTWKALVDDDRVAENQARFLQFQEQLDSVIGLCKTPGSGVDFASAVATDFFTFLPSVGFLPVTAESLQGLVCLPQTYEPQSPDQGGTVGTVSVADPGLGLTEEDMRMLGAFVGSAAGGVLTTVVPGLGVAGVLGAASRVGGLSGLGNWFGDLLHLGGGAVAPIEAGASLGNIGSLGNVGSIQDVLGQVSGLQQQLDKLNQQLGVQSPAQAATPPPQSQPVSTQQTLVAAPKKLPRHVVSHRQFRDKLCYRLNQTRTTNDGFDLSTFFGDHIRINLIGSDRIDTVLHQSWYEDAIDMRPTQTTTIPWSDDVPGNQGLQPLPLWIDIYLVEENLFDTTAPLYVIFHKSLHPIEYISIPKQDGQDSSSDPSSPEPSPR